MKVQTYFTVFSQTFADPKHINHYKTEQLVNKRFRSLGFLNSKISTAKSTIKNTMYHLETCQKPHCSIALYSSFSVLLKICNSALYHSNTQEKQSEIKE